MDIVKKQLNKLTKAELLELKVCIDKEVKRREELPVQCIQELINALRSDYNKIYYGDGDWKSEKVKDAVSELEYLGFDRIMAEINKLDDIQSKCFISVKYIPLVAGLIRDAAEYKATIFGSNCDSAGSTMTFKRVPGCFYEKAEIELHYFFEDIVDDCLKEGYLPSEEELEKLSDCLCQLDCYAERFEMNLKRLKERRIIWTAEHGIKFLRSEFNEIDFGNDWKSEKAILATFALYNLIVLFDMAAENIDRLDNVQSKFSTALKLIDVLVTVIAGADENAFHRVNGTIGSFCPDAAKELDNFFERIVDYCLKEGHLPSKEELEKLSDCRFRLGCYGERFEMILNRLTDSIKEQSKSSANNGEPPAKKARKNRYTETKF